jgi:hypothetical protein
MSATQLAATATRLPETPKAPVSVEALNLKEDKVYQAVVSQLVNSKIPTTAAQTEKTTPTNTEWLLKLNGKLLLISSEKPLQLGQTLLVKLDASTQTLTVLPSTIPQTASLHKPNSPISSNAAVTLLLSAINQVMPRQVSLETGLTALEMFSKQNSSQQVSNQAKIILLMLSKQAPAQQLFTAAEKTSSTSAITHFLKDSGVFFESGAKQHLSNPNSLKLQISQIQAALNVKQNTKLANAVQALQPTHTSGIIQNSSSETSKPNTTSSAFNAIRTALLSKIQTTQQATQQGTPHTTAINNTNPGLPSSSSPLSTLLNSITTSLNAPNNSIGNSTIHNDLKGLLLSITAALKADNTSSKLSTRSHIEALAQPDLLKNPFNFPHLANQSAALTSSKTKSLIADQQFTTGQLLKLIAGMLNRIQFNQLNSLYQSHSNSNESSTVQSWFFELPVTNPHNQLSTFEVRIDQEEDMQKQDQEQDDPDQKVQWKLALSFNFEQLGAIYVQVTLAPPAISSTIWADRPETLELINREKPHFQSKLADLGLEVGDISCQKGQPKHDKTRLDRSLVDIKA